MSPRILLRGILALVALLGLLGSPAVARAQSESEKRQQAKEHYELANRFYDVGKYGDAIHEYEQAYLLVEDPALLFNIGQAYRLWDKPEDALRSYKNYLRKRPDASNRPDVEKKIADLERTLEERRRIGGTQSPPPLTPVPPPVVTPAPGTSPAAGEPPPALPPAVSVEPAPIRPGVDVSSAAPVAPPSHPRWLAYSLLGVGGACLLTSAIAAAVGASKAQKLKTASQNSDVFDPAVESNGKAANNVAILSGLAGVAAAGTGGYLLWRWRRSSPAAVSVIPSVNSTYAGASALLTF